MAALAAQARLVHIIGTTGFDADQDAQIAAAARHARIVKSGNMSLGVNMLAGLVRQAAAQLDDDWDIEIVDMHHRHKVDAPSGTALLLGEAAAARRGVSLDDVKESGRDGIGAPRAAGNIGFAALRGGSVVGDHEVILAGTHEHIRLAHRAEDRDIFARGALKAALWAKDQSEGLYSMQRCFGVVRPNRLTLKSNKENEMSHLVLVRHGQSEWNEKNLFTGWRDPDLTAQGIDEAKAAGQALKQQGLVFDLAFTSDLQRAQKTLTLLLAEQGQSDLPTTKNQALNERDYGDLAGLNKDDAREKWGAEQVHIWRRSYDTPPPGGESLKDTGARVLPYYDSAILPHVKTGKNILIAAHGNSLRSLVMRLEGLSSAEILDVNIDTGVPYIYQMDADGAVQDKTILSR